MNIPKETPEEWLEKTLAFAELIGRDTKPVYMVYEMMKHPLTLEEKRLQIYKGCPEMVRPKGWKPKVTDL
jgi:hypothetical protein